MPKSDRILNEIQTPAPSQIYLVRNKYMQMLHALSGRNIIAYYSGWLQSRGEAPYEINDNDMNLLMNAVEGLDKSKGLDLILHSPGGDITATEAIVKYLHRVFSNNIRCIIPQLAMSAGTMIACGTEEIIMGKQSSIGPIDPKYGSISCYAVLDEIKRAQAEIESDPKTFPTWKIIIEKYPITFIGECEKAILLSSEITSKFLKNYMFKSTSLKNSETITKIVGALNNHADTKNHSRHICIEEAKKLGLKIKNMEDDQPLQDAILSIHHAFMWTLENEKIAKIVENHNGTGLLRRYQ